MELMETVARRLQVQRAQVQAYNEDKRKGERYEKTR